MSFAANVADWRCFITIVGIMLAGSHTPKTKFVLLKEVSFFFQETEWCETELINRLGPFICRIVFRFRVL